MNNTIETHLNKLGYILKKVYGVFYVLKDKNVLAMIKFKENSPRISAWFKEDGFSKAKSMSYEKFVEKLKTQK